MLNHEQYYNKNIHETKGCFILYLTIYKIIVYDIEPNYGKAMIHLPSSLSKLSRIVLLMVGHFVPT